MTALSTRLTRLAVALALAGSASFVLAAVDTKASRFYEDALDRYEKRDLPGAIIQLKNALQIDRTMLPVQVLLGRALLGDGQAAAAEVALLEALKLGVNRAEVVLPLAQALIAQGKQQQVIDQAQFNPGGLPPAVQLQLHLLRSGAASDLGDVRAALASIDAARAIDRNAVDSWIAEVPVRVRSRQFAEALTAANRALAISPTSAEANYQLGTVRHVKGDLNGALAAYDKAIALSAQHTEARIARAGLYIDLGRIDAATKDLAELKRGAPKEPRGAYMEALLADRNGDSATARAALQRVTALLDPVPMSFLRYRAQLLMLNGLAHHGLGESEKAKPYLESYQRQQGGSVISKLLAQIYVGESNVTRAIEILDDYIKQYPNDGQALAMLASVHMSQGRNAKATALMQDALRQRDVPELRTVLGRSLIGGGHVADGITQLEAVLKRDPEQAVAAASLASALLSRGEVPRALALLEGLAKREPRNASYQNMLGLARAAKGDVVGARAAFEQAVKLAPDLLPVKLNLVRLDVVAKSYDAAAARLAALLKIDERNADVLFESAVLAERRDQLPDAQRWLEKAVDREPPRQLRSGLALVDFHLRHGNPPAALEAAKRVASKAPDDLKALLAYSRALLAVGDAAGARSSLGRATTVAEFDAPLQTEIAALQLAAKNVDGAAYSLDKALSGQPDFIPALALRGDVDLRQGDPARAEQRARRVVALAPRSALGYGMLGDVALARGQGAAAVEAFRRAHDIEPSSLTLSQLFKLQWQQDSGRTSLALAEQWIKSHPGDLAVRKAAADGYARVANYAAARKAYTDILAITPGDGDVLNNLANALLRLKDPQAVTVAERALAARPNSAAAVDTLGWVLFHNGQPDRALQLLRDARLRDPNDPEIRFHLAAALAQSGRKAAAHDELQAALKMGRGFESQADAQSLLRSLQ